jgi:microcin C transport system permease protein
VRAARASGVSNQIMWRHILPNSMTPVVTFAFFRMSAAILLMSLDFLNLPHAFTGELLSQARPISMRGGFHVHFGVLVITPPSSWATLCGCWILERCR